MALIPWGEWAPDSAVPNSGFAAKANGVIPRAVGYGPYPDQVEATDAEALPDEPRGSAVVRLFDGSSQVYYGTDTDIYVLESDNTWTSISSGHNVTEGDDWSFAQYGAYLINTNTGDDMRAYNFEAPAGNNLISGAPPARSAFTCGNVLFGLGTASNPRRFESSGIGDHTAWNSKGATGKTLEDGGTLICGHDLKNGIGVMFQDSAIRLVQFGGSGTGSLYSLTKIADGKGAVSARSVVPYDGTVFFLAPDGFYSLSAGAGMVAIGADKINDWFFDQVAADDLASVQAYVDPFHQLVTWRLNEEQLLAYRWTQNRWSTLPASTVALSRLASAGIAADDLDQVADDIDIPLDSRQYMGTAQAFGGLNTDRKFFTFTGNAMAGSVRTAMFNNRTTGIINRATPISGVTTSTLSLGTSDRVDNDLVWNEPVAKVRDGSVPIRGRGKNIGFEEFFPAGADWNSAAVGIDHIQSSQGGPR
jgi:hypothetical protein